MSKQCEGEVAELRHIFLPSICTHTLQLVFLHDTEKIIAVPTIKRYSILQQQASGSQMAVLSSAKDT